jgi:E3 ubiquitin-protein ligase CHFR
MPCLHNFCGGCFTDWIGRSKDCPHCREKVHEVKKNAMINSVISGYLLMNPHLKKSEDIVK